MQEFNAKKMAEANKFLGINETENFARDIYGDVHCKSYYETVTKIYEQTEYEINYKK